MSRRRFALTGPNVDYVLEVNDSREYTWSSGEIRTDFTYTLKDINLLNSITSRASGSTTEFTINYIGLSKVTTITSNIYNVSINNTNISDVNNIPILFYIINYVEDSGENQWGSFWVSKTFTYYRIEKKTDEDYPTDELFIERRVA